MCNLLPVCKDKRLKNSKIREAENCRPATLQVIYITYWLIGSNLAHLSVLLIRDNLSC
jgi:hypothetical protein